MTDNNDDAIESVLVINIYNTVNVGLDGETLARFKAGKDTSNSADSGDAPDDDDSDSTLDLFRSKVLDSFKSDQQNAANYNTVNISPDARFFRAGKTDDENRKANAAARAILKAGKTDDQNASDILRALDRVFEIDAENANTGSNKKRAAAKTTKKSVKKNRAPRRSPRG
jgi:hypothetical protein